MRVLVVYCHPVPDSFNAAIRDAVLRGLAKAGHETELLDLYAEDFNPVLSETERRNYHTEGTNIAPVADELARLKRADGLVFVYPTWWYGPPAMLKGWLDRVLVPHETFGMPKAYRMLERKLTNIKTLAAVSTLGSPWLWWLWIGQPGRRILIDGLAEIIDPKAQKLWMALHSMDRATPAKCSDFLRSVEARFTTL